MRRACKGGSGCAAALRLHECVRAVSVAAGSVIPAPHSKIQAGGPRERLALVMSCRGRPPTIGSSRRCILRRNTVLGSWFAETM